MENVLYIDQIIKKTLKKWKLIILVTAIITICMGIGGYFSVTAVNDYQYYASIIIDTENDVSKEADMDTMVQRAYKIFTSNRVSDKVHLEYGYELDTLKAIFCSVNATSGELAMTLNISKETWKPENINILEAFFDTAKKIFEEEFPEYRVVVVNTPALLSTPDTKQEFFELRIQSITNYLINGAFMGLIVAIFISVLCVLWKNSDTETNV